MPSASLSKIILRVHRPSDNNEDHMTDPLSPVKSNGIVLGTGFQAGFKLQDDLDVDAAHGTLERTSGLSVWVYSDHSKHGSMLNGEQKIHNDAVVVHHGDTLKLGRTEIQLCLEMGKSQDPQDETQEKEEISPISTNQEGEVSARSAARMARRRASTPWGSTAMSKTQQVKQRQLRIETSGPGFEPGAIAVEPMATPPEYTASPVSGTRWRRKRNSIATTTLMTKRAPSPPLDEQGHPQSFHRPHTRFIQGSEMPPQLHLDEAGTTARPPPLEYSSSPTVSPSSLRHRHNLFHQPPNSLPTPGTGLIAGVPPPPISTGARPTSRRDDLRIQVSKKMAAAAPASVAKTNVPRVVPKALEFQAPASPVAQRDILKQQESLQTILQHKFEEELLLKQQQEEWMRQNLMPVSSNDNKHRSGSSTPPAPLSPIKNVNKSLADIDPDKLALFPSLSLGITEQRTIRPSPRLTAAIRASRVRLNSFEDKPDQPQHHDWKGRRKTSARTFGPSMSKIQGASISPLKKNELRTSDESIASTATTVVTCHRRITRSVSSDSAGSVDLCDFVGYEEEEDCADTVTSYTTPDLYGSDELLRRSREDTTLLFDANRDSSGSVTSMYGTLSPPQSNTSSFSPSNATDTRLGSPRRRGTETPDTSSSSSNQLLNDSPVPSYDKNIALGSRVWSPRGGHFDPQSPYKSTAALKKNQQPPPQKLRRPRPEPEEADESEITSKPQPFRRRTSVRRHSLTPLSDVPSFTSNNSES
ncbi:hypothetical protein PHPALM_30807 [Phytophthora palmivora]|uniref:FHA domain-containing protein n=1 Tax=Phytophthora palmivora TaxID=4796 RepID=A0A2P4X477_9STRA|nr:hypothetical protein PHPALM_30807 [Phytophthora palmivora]